MGSALSTLMIIGIILGIAATVFLYVKVLPKKCDGNLNNKFLQFLHDFFHFKHLYIEEILKFLFTLATCLCIAVGFMLLFGRVEYYYYGFGSYGQSTFGYGLLIMVGGPILLRITYELTMMLVLLVKNVMDINGKLKAGCCKAEPDVEPAAPAAPEAPAEEAPAEEAPAEPAADTPAPADDTGADN